MHGEDRYVRIPTTRTLKREVYTAIRGISGQFTVTRDVVVTKMHRNAVQIRRMYSLYVLIVHGFVSLPCYIG